MYDKGSKDTDIPTPFEIHILLLCLFTKCKEVKYSYCKTNKSLKSCDFRVFFELNSTESVEFVVC